MKINNWNKFENSFAKAEPFPYLEIKNFLSDEKAKNILKALLKEKFYEKESDLFKFLQTDDLNFAKNKCLLEFRNFLCSKEFIDYMGKITNIKLKYGVVDISGSIYRNTDYLLCHDDRLEGRKIAYLFYLSDFTLKEGGSLNLFSSKKGLPDKVIKKIFPKFNTFVFFEVSDLSFHEVEEVLTDKQRIAIGGWFHG